MFASSVGWAVLERGREGVVPLPLPVPFMLGARGPLRWSLWWVAGGGGGGGASAISVSEPSWGEGLWEPLVVEGGRVKGGG